MALLVIPAFVTPTICYAQAGGHGEGNPGAGVAVDSMHVIERNMDTLLKEDSIQQAHRADEERRLTQSKQLATQREIDLTNDGKPEVLRLSGMLDKQIDRTQLTFTIKSGNKLLFKDSWKAGGYFDTIDHLPDSVKVRRLRRLVTVFFANENFEVVDSVEFDNIMGKVPPADLAPHSAQAYELFREPRVMYSVYHSRDYWYGLTWDPKQQKFIRVWKN